MHLGKHDLNQNEAEWFTNFSKDVLTQAFNKTVSSLNKKCSIEDVCGLLKHVWSKSSTDVSTEEAEAQEIYDADVEADDNVD